MKKSSLLMIAAVILLSSCGTSVQLGSSSNDARFQDGIYSSTPSFRSREERVVSQNKTDALVEETKASRVYLFGEKKDSVIIPQNMSATIKYDKAIGSTVVTVGENPYDWQNNINPWTYYTPYSIGSSWYWSRHYDPWYYNTWSYSPWRYGGWYDPWYGYAGWYDPWYYSPYGYYGYYGPYWGYHHHYCGWYGGWDPYWDHHYHGHHHGGVIIHEDRWHGSRISTGSERIFTSSSPVRSGVATTSRVSRTVQAGGVDRSSTGRVSATSGRTGATRVSAAPGRTSSIGKGTAATVSRPATTVTTRPAVSSGTVSNHRKPAVRTGSSTARPSAGTSSGSRTSAYRSSSSSATRSSSYSSGSSSSRSSYGSSSSRSSYSSGSSSRSSSYSGGSSRSGGSYSGGGSSRSGGSSGARR